MMSKKTFPSGLTSKGRTRRVVTSRNELRIRSGAGIVESVCSATPASGWSSTTSSRSREGAPARIATFSFCVRDVTGVSPTGSEKAVNPPQGHRNVGPLAPDAEGRETKLRTLLTAPGQASACASRTAVGC